MHPIKHRPASLSLFCKVVDNYGDIGICWRLARQLTLEHGIAVTLWVDDLPSFRRICHSVVIDKETQQIDLVAIRHWRSQNSHFQAADVTDIVIEFFGCDIPPSYIAAMAQRSPHPVWLNLDGLTAEEWVEGCHTLPSPHPTSSLIKYFFYPGFTNKTGGLIREATLVQQRQVFQQNGKEINNFLSNLGLTPTEMSTTKISLFCYPDAPVQTLFEVWIKSAAAVTCLVPEGVANPAMHAFFGHYPKVGESKTNGALTVRLIPFLNQPDYDKLLWACDFNFVRGEDSFVRAQWAERPFIWHIYPQDNNLHHIKLAAFLQRYTAKTDSLTALTLSWNGATTEPLDFDRFNELWRLLKTDMTQITTRSSDWRQEMEKNNNLTSNLVRFAETICLKTGK